MNTDPKKSASPCGCDEGASHLCQRHRDAHSGGVLAGSTPLSSHVVVHDGGGSLPWQLLQTIHDSGERVTYASGSMRDPSIGKIKWSRILFGPMARRWALHLTTAEAKYPDAAPGVPNFMLIETDEEYFRYKESALRHFMSWYYEETDEDHASAVFFNVNGIEIIKDKRKAREGK